MNKMIIGRYLQGNSLIHRLDPRTKILASFFYIIIVFFANNLTTNLILLAFVTIGVLLSRVKISYFLRGIRPMVSLILITVLFQIFFTQGEEVIWQWGIIKISQAGIRNAGFVFMRLFLVIVMSTLLTLTTSPTELTDGLELLLRPFARFGLPVHELALVISIALRFVPTLADEATKIMDAQRSRGADFDEGSLFDKIKALVPVLVPLFVSAFSRAEDLATAMEARGYRGGDGRTRYRQLKFTGFDYSVWGSCLILLAAIIGLRG